MPLFYDFALVCLMKPASRKLKRAGTRAREREREREASARLLALLFVRLADCCAHHKEKKCLLVFVCWYQKKC